MKIVFADDHVMIREALKPFLMRLHETVEVHEAGCMTEVLAHLDRIQPALVLLDLNMPGMNGTQGIAQVKKRKPAAKCAILSASNDRQTALDSMAAGADGFIPKHLSGAAMVSALQLILAGERFIPSILFQAPEHGQTDDPLSAYRLTHRENDILMLLKDGLSNKSIANRLGVSDVTVKTHLGNAFRKLGVQNRMQAIRLLLARPD